MHPADERLNRPGGLAARLYRARKAAGLRQDQLADALTWDRTKVSKIENGRQTPSEDDIRAWARETGRPGEADDLIEMLHDVAAVHTRWRRRLRGGLAGVQEDIGQRTEAAKRIRNAELVLIPGLLQTAGYARAIIAQMAATYHVNDVDAAVAARLRRQAVLYDQSKTFEFTFTEAALRMFPCPPDVMRGQLDRLLSLDLPNVTIGVIPPGQVPQMPWQTFLMLDGYVIVETYGGRDEDAGGTDSAVHERIFEGLLGEALTGEAARRLIAAAAAGLRES